MESKENKSEVDERIKWLNDRGFWEDSEEYYIEDNETTEESGDQLQTYMITRADEIISEMLSFKYNRRPAILRRKLNK